MGNTPVTDAPTAAPTTSSRHRSEAQRQELIEATRAFQAALTERGVEAAEPSYKRVHAKAKDLKDMCAQIQKDASEGKYAAIDNWARKTRQLEAKCRLLVKVLKEAEGKP